MDRCGEVRDCRLPHTYVGGNSERVICLVGDQTVMFLEHHERNKEDWRQERVERGYAYGLAEVR